MMLKIEFKQVASMLSALLLLTGRTSVLAWDRSPLLLRRLAGRSLDAHTFGGLTSGEEGKASVSSAWRPAEVCGENETGTIGAASREEEAFEPVEVLLRGRNFAVVNKPASIPCHDSEYACSTKPRDLYVLSCIHPLFLLRKPLMSLPMCDV
jgi:hypothetical protein